MITFDLPYPPTTNNLFINVRRGRIRSQKYDSWIQEAGCEIMRQRPRKVEGPVSLNYEFQEVHKVNRKRDLGNLEKATTDLLVKHGIIEADHDLIVRRVSANWNAEVEGVRITIQPVFNRVPETQTESATNDRTRT